MSIIDTQHKRLYYCFSDAFEENVSNEDLKHFLHWCNDQGITHRVCFCVSDDINDIVDKYSNDDWKEFDFVYDIKLKTVFMYCIMHEQLLNSLYCYHNKIDLDECLSLYQYGSEYTKKHGFYKSSVMDKIICSEQLQMPQEIMCLSHLFSEDWE